LVPPDIDCDTLPAVSEQFHYTHSIQQSAAAAVKAGNDINCGPEYVQLVNASISGFIQEADIDTAVRRLLRRRVQVGDLDLPGEDPYGNVSGSVVDSPHSQAVARRVVAESVVLLHNADDVLPLARGRHFAVIGPSADDITVQAHTYHGTPQRWITILAGLREVAGPDTSFTYVQGCSRTGTGPSDSNFTAAIATADAADAIIFVGGLQASMEEEGTDRIDSIALPGMQVGAASI